MFVSFSRHPNSSISFKGLRDPGLSIGLPGGQKLDTIVEVVGLRGYWNCVESKKLLAVLFAGIVGSMAGVTPLTPKANSQSVCYRLPKNCGPDLQGCWRKEPGEYSLHSTHPTTRLSCWRDPTLQTFTNTDLTPLSSLGGYKLYQAHMQKYNIPYQVAPAAYDMLTTIDFVD